MTVFKGFLIITKRNLLMVFMYLAIFLTIGILASGSDSNTSGSGFHAQALTIGVVDHDGGVLSKGLSTYLSQYHTIRQMPDDRCCLIAVHIRHLNIHQNQIISSCRFFFQFIHAENAIFYAIYGKSHFLQQ